MEAAGVTKRGVSTTLTGDRESISRELNIVLIIISILFYGSRCFSRLFLYRNPGIDDALIGAALVLAIALSSLEIKAVEYGAGRQEADVAASNPEGLRSFFKLMPTMFLIYFGGTGLVRLGIAAFLTRLTRGLPREKIFNTSIMVLASAITALTVGSTFALLFECWPVQDLWHKDEPDVKCYGPEIEALVMYIHAAMSVAFDLILFIIPIWIIMTYAIKIQLRLIFTFSIGLVAAVCGLVRLAMILKVNMAVNTTFNITHASVWSDTEIHVGIWVSCLPALQPLLRVVTKRLGIKSAVAGVPNAHVGYDRFGRSTGDVERGRPKGDVERGRSKDDGRDTWHVLGEIERQVSSGGVKNVIEGRSRQGTTVSTADTEVDIIKGDVIMVRTQVEVSRTRSSRTQSAHTDGRKESH